MFYSTYLHNHIFLNLIITLSHSCPDITACAVSIIKQAYRSNLRLILTIDVRSSCSTNEEDSIHLLVHCIYENIDCVCVWCPSFIHQYSFIVHKLGQFKADQKKLRLFRCGHIGGCLVTRWRRELISQFSKNLVFSEFCNSLHT